MHIEESIKLDFKDVLIRPKRSTLTSRQEVDIHREFVFRHSGRRYRGIPIIAANMDTTGTMAMAEAFARYDMSVALHKHYAKDTLVAFFAGLRDEGKQASTAFYSMGIGEADYDKFCAVMTEAGEAIEYACIDVANGYTEGFIHFVKKVRQQFPRLTIMAGNVVTGDITEELILAGADIVKVGIGPGSVCTTRKMTGVGYPQLSAVIECADAAHGLGGQICADGGCVVPGDLSKAFGGGADFVMVGGMLAGYDECEGELIERDGRKFKRFYGMSSRVAMEKYAGGVAEYRATEGKEVLVEYRGPVANAVQDILGGVRSACTYVGARKLKELTKRTTFVRVTEQLNESLGKS